MTHTDFQIGDRVLIISKKSKYKGQMATVGEINCGVNHYIGVYPDNAKSIYYKGYLYNKTLKLCKKSIQKIESEDNNMAKLTGFNKVAVLEQGCYQKDYFYALYDESVCAGDKVLVTGSAIGQMWTVKDVIDYDEDTINKNITAEVICKVDTTDYDKRCKNRKKAEELRKQMDKKRKEIEARKDDEYYASLDPEYAAMLDNMKKMMS